MYFLMSMNHATSSDERKVLKYKNKYNHLKRMIKNFVIENAALCDEVAKIQESIVIVKEERKFLLRKLLEFENNSENTPQSNKLPAQGPVNGSKVKKRKSPEVNSKNITS